jgi:hypothetical protein
MRRLWFRRRAVSTMIGGIIVLSLFLVALVAMIVVSSQYDSYQTTVSTMQQNDINRFSENLQGTGQFKFVQVSTSSTCPQCNVYQFSLTNYGIGAQIASIYIWTDPALGAPSSGFSCNAQRFSPPGDEQAPCIFNSAVSPIPYSFAASDRYINPGEVFHIVTLYVPSNIALTWDNQQQGSQSVTIVTTRGRVFSFVYPTINPGAGAGPAGGTGLQIGPLVVTFQEALLTYTVSNVYSSSNPALPIGGSNGGWILPTSQPLIIYIKIQTDWWATSDVYLTPQSVVELAQYNSPGSVTPFYVVAPTTPTLCNIFYQAPINEPGNLEMQVDCSSSYSGGSDGSAGGTPYLACGITPSQYFNDQPGNGQPVGCGTKFRYRIPKPTLTQWQKKERGNPVYVAFGSGVAGQGGNPNKVSISHSWNGGSVMSYLFLQYVYSTNGGTTGAYMYGVTLPFVAICIDDSGTCRITAGL